jgi:hypothetical protein
MIESHDSLDVHFRGLVYTFHEVLIFGDETTWEGDEPEITFDFKSVAIDGIPTDEREIRELDRVISRVIDDTIENYILNNDIGYQEWQSDNEEVGYPDPVEIDY